MSALLLVAAALLPLGPCAAQEPSSSSNAIALPFGSAWRFWDKGASGPGAGWRETSFADASWREGFGILGYGKPSVATTISFGPSETRKYISAYFRRSVTWNREACLVAGQLKCVSEMGANVPAPRCPTAPHVPCACVHPHTATPRNHDSSQN